mmetsp:Transcript_20930/g.67827  ORF Transcript_20930/g.67827 Transcript_20930/m.67827 type:complete len:240 (+) Transcript_20930:520-1239(+)
MRDHFLSQLACGDDAAAAPHIADALSKGRKQAVPVPWHNDVLKAIGDATHLFLKSLSLRLPRGHGFRRGRRAALPRPPTVKADSRQSASWHRSCFEIPLPRFEPSRPRYLGLIIFHVNILTTRQQNHVDVPIGSGSADPKGHSSTHVRADDLRGCKPVVTTEQIQNHLFRIARRNRSQLPQSPDLLCPLAVMRVTAAKLLRSHCESKATLAAKSSLQVHHVIFTAVSLHPLEADGLPAA